MDDTDTSAWAGPLAGVRVLDFTRVLAGPAASLALADLGAEVIKIEPPVTGDDTRTFPPFREGESHYYLAVNRGKKSIVLDLKSADGLRIAKELATKSDIVLENYRPGVMERLGLGYAALSADHPGLIYCSISGFGHTGPMKDRPSFDIVLQALSGALSVNGEKDGLPTKLGIPLGDLVGGVNGPIAILGALYERTRTGVGRHIDISLLDGMLGMLGYLAQLAFFTGEDPAPLGSQHPNLVPYGVFPAADGAMVIACLTNAFWARVCAALNLPDAEHDSRFSSLEARKANRDAVNGLIAGVTQTQTMARLAETLTTYQVPHAPILGIQAALAQPQAVAREMVVEVDHATLGRIPIVNRPFRFTDTPQATPAPPPVLGQDSDAILSDVLGLNRDEIAALRSGGAVA